MSGSVAGPLSYVAAICLAITFTWAAASKLTLRSRWTAALHSYGLPSWVERPARLLVPLAELGVVCGLAWGWGRAAAGAALAMMLVFSAFILSKRSSLGERLPCGCFGGRDRSLRVLLGRNVAIGAAALVCLINWPGRPRVTAPAGDELVAAGLVLAGAAFAAWAAISSSRALRAK